MTQAQPETGRTTSLSDFAPHRNADEIKRLVISALDKNGVLAQLRSTVKLHVSRIINEENPSIESQLSSRIRHVETEKMTNLLSTERGQVLTELIADFLQTYEMKDTLSMFIAEANLRKLRPSRQQLASICCDDGRGVVHSDMSVLELCLNEQARAPPPTTVTPELLLVNDILPPTSSPPCVFSPPADAVNPNTSLENDMQHIQGISHTIAQIVDTSGHFDFLNDSNNGDDFLHAQPLLMSPVGEGPRIRKFNNPIDDNVLFESRESFKDLIDNEVGN